MPFVLRFPVENRACGRLPFQERGLMFRKPQLVLYVGTLQRVRFSQNTFEVMYRSQERPGEKERKKTEEK